MGLCAGLNFGCRGSSGYKSLESFFPHLCRKLLRGIKRNGPQSPGLPRAWLPKSKHAEPHIPVSLELSAGTGRGFQAPCLLKFQMQRSKQALINRELLQPVPRHERQSSSREQLQLATFPARFLSDLANVDHLNTECRQPMQTGCQSTRDHVIAGGGDGGDIL